MSKMRNKVQLIGRLGANPEIITFKDGNQIAKFSLATNESYRDQNQNKIEKVLWHNIVFNGGLVKVAQDFLEKGQEIAVEGKLSYRNWEDKEGNKKYITEIIVNDLLLLGSYSNKKETAEEEE